MQTIYFVKARIPDHPEFLCGVFSTTDLANKYIEDSIKNNSDTSYRVENWKMDYYS
jgi:hypothetical protein